ncbi:Sodium/calcium exchanger MaX1 [ANME-1 cluster archaeon GoMg1]|nr:Sodium/calcium exchanger MaX1 [ANME-1 cluster archaeon GoMg1]
MLSHESGVAIAVLVLIGCFVAFFYLTRLFVSGLGSLAKRFNVPESVVGASVAAMVSSAPEMGTSIFSVVEGHPDIGMGTIVGSAIFNISLLIAISLWVKKCVLDEHVLKRDGAYYLFVVIVTIVTIMDGVLTQWEALTWFLLYVVYFIWLFRDAITGKFVPKEEFKYVPTKKAVFYMGIGIGGIALSADIMVRSTVHITNSLGLSESLFSLIIIAVATSIPDLFVSVEAARNGMGSLAVSNAVGSNIFDILVGIGLPFSFVAATPVYGNIGLSAIYLLVSVFVFLGIIMFRKSLGKKEACVLAAVYLSYLFIVILC